MCLRKIKKGCVSGLEVSGVLLGVLGLTVLMVARSWQATGVSDER